MNLKEEGRLESLRKVNLNLFVCLFQCHAVIKHQVFLSKLSCVFIPRMAFNVKNLIHTSAIINVGKAHQTLLRD